MGGKALVKLAEVDRAEEEQGGRGLSLVTCMEVSDMQENHVVKENPAHQGTGKLSVRDLALTEGKGGQPGSGHVSGTEARLPGAEGYTSALFPFSDQICGGPGFTWEQTLLPAKCLR